MRPTRKRRVPFEVSKLPRIGAVGVDEPKLLLLFFAGGRKEGERFGVRRPGRCGVGPVGASDVYHDGRTVLGCRLDVGLLGGSCRGGLDPGDVSSIRRKSDITVKHGLTELFRQL